MIDRSFIAPLPVTDWVTVRATQDRSSTNAAATDVPDLAVDLLANTVYEFEAVLKVNSSDVNGMKYAMNFTGAGGVITALYEGAVTATTAAVSATNALATLDASAFCTYAGDGEVVIKGHIVVAGTAGQVRVQQGKLTAGTAIVRSGSVLRVRQVA